MVVSWIGEILFQFVGEGLVESFKRFKFGRSPSKTQTRERQKILERRAKQRVNRRKNK
jgi:hypothetical protein